MHKGTAKTEFGGAFVHHNFSHSFLAYFGNLLIWMPANMNC